jgi:beta-aspartyl-dipeptidase (metallo-type)
MILITQIDVYAPDFLGKKDVLIAGERIHMIENKIDHKVLKNAIELDIIDGKDKKLMPGLIDAHVHIAGAGGEGGPASRTPELQLSQLLSGGITTVVGCLGTDGITRTPASVLMKAKALRKEGVSAFMYTGSYQVPTPTITGDIATDITFIEEVIGVGEIALSDHRSSVPTLNELIRLAEHARVAGMLAGKAGVLNIHMGDAKDPFRPIYDAVEKSELKFNQFFPTHCNRNHYIFEDSKTFGKKGVIDITASSYPYFSEYEIKPSKAILELLTAGVPENHITMTSDAIGSLPGFDKNGELTRLDVGLPKSIFTELVDAVTNENIPLETALKTVTSNVADVLKLKKKGRLKKGFDADILIVQNDFSIHTLIAKGKFMIKEEKLIVKGTYEK